VTCELDNTALVSQVAAELRRLARPGAICIVAVSGGPDSLALLDLLHRGSAEHEHELIVGHVNHGIHPDSDAVARMVATAAGERGLPFHAARLTLDADASETDARRARRAALRDIAAATGAGAIVLAHHADDQAETVLLRLLRGSGPAGLAGMAARRGPWLRPLLRVRRTELAAYAASSHLAGWVDPANADPRHLRSWLRVAVLPGLSARLPDLVECLTRSAAQAAAARAAWEAALELLPGLDVEAAIRGISVAASAVQGYRSPLRHAILAALGRHVGVLLGARRLVALDRLLMSRSGAGAATLAKGIRAELAFGRLTLYQIERAGPESVVLVPGEAATLGDSRFETRVESAQPAVRGGWTAALSPGAYAVRRWRPGDRIRPLGGAGSRAVAVLLREARIPPARRAAWPVVVNADDATIVWVPGICRADAEVPAEGTEAWRVECAIA
jgi:tRNA(Ile)-lysidine synthase